MADTIEKQLKETTTKSLPLTKICQGAEAIVFLCSQHPFNDQFQGKVILKYRPRKKYRHETLDYQLTKHRTLAEGRLLAKLYQNGVKVPRLIFVDPYKGLIWMENIEGDSLKQWIWDKEVEGGNNDVVMMKDTIIEVGIEIGNLHQLNTVHGDLTSSNVLLRLADDDTREPVLIDFGLASQSNMAEDKAVDLYVLERAIESTHPVHSKTYNEWLLQGYAIAHKQDKGARQKLQEVIKRLESVRARGRKRSMLG